MPLSAPCRRNPSRVQCIGDIAQSLDPGTLDFSDDWQHSRGMPSGNGLNRCDSISLCALNLGIAKLYAPFPRGGYPSSATTQNAPKKQADSATCEGENRGLGSGQIKVLRGGYDLRGIDRELAEFILELEVGGIVIRAGDFLPDEDMPDQIANNDNAPAPRKRAA